MDEFAHCTSGMLAVADGYGELCGRTIATKELR
jgi:hypothetical protein